VRSGRDLGFQDKPIVDLRYELSTAIYVSGLTKVCVEP
jgi:hypothetical protein